MHPPKPPIEPQKTSVASRPPDFRGCSCMIANTSQGLLGSFWSFLEGPRWLRLSDIPQVCTARTLRARRARTVTRAPSELQPRLPPHGLHCHLRSTLVRLGWDCSGVPSVLLPCLPESGQRRSGSRAFRAFSPRAPPHGLSAGRALCRGRGGGGGGAAPLEPGHLSWGRPSCLHPCDPHARAKALCRPRPALCNGRLANPNSDRALPIQRPRPGHVLDAGGPPYPPPPRQQPPDAPLPKHNIRQTVGLRRWRALQMGTRAAGTGFGERGQQDAGHPWKEAGEGGGTGGATPWIWSRTPSPRVTFRRVVAPLQGPGQSPVLPFACCVGSLRSVSRCGRCSCRCRFRVRGAQSLVYRGCDGCGGMCRLRVSGAQ